jgi:cell division cycle protein 37
VDKRSFIRAKQNQIHQQRFERKNKIETYKYERIINDGLLQRINALLDALKSHKDEAEKRSPDELIFQAIMESVGNSQNDQPPPPPAGVHTQEKELPTYSKMMAALVDQVKAKVDEDNVADRFGAYVKEVEGHKTKVEDLQKQLLEQLNTLEKEEGRKITSDSYTTGFSTSHISKSDSRPVDTPKTTKKETVQAVEVLNPAALKNQPLDRTESSGADADVDEPDVDDDDEEVECSPEGKVFGKIKMGDYRACLEFISKNPKILAEKETDGLLVLAFNAAIEGHDELSRQYVHQGLLLQYCRALGRDGVQLFFKRITTQGHQAQKVFFDDVQSTYARIKTRTKEIIKQRAQEESEGAGTEQIQLHAVDPGTTINIRIPPADTQDPEESKARQLFDAFPPGLQRALESGSLDEVNKVLGKMSVEEAEEVVGQLGEVSFRALHLTWCANLDSRAACFRLKSKSSMLRLPKVKLH